jgi:hypothetical protein
MTKRHKPQHQYGGGEVDYNYDDGDRFAEYEKVRERMPFARRGSEGYEVRYGRLREQLLAEYITDRAQHYCRYVPDSEPPSDPESEGE